MIHTFPRGISRKMNATAPQELELAYNDSALQHFNYYATDKHTHCVN